MKKIILIISYEYSLIFFFTNIFKIFPGATCVMELCTANIDSCLTIKKLQDKVLTSYYLAKWSKINIFLRNSLTYSSFFCKKICSANLY